MSGSQSDAADAFGEPASPLARSGPLSETSTIRRRSRACPAGGSPRSPEARPPEAAPETVEQRLRPQGGGPRGNQGFPRETERQRRLKPPAAAPGVSILSGEITHSPLGVALGGNGPGGFWLCGPANASGLSVAISWRAPCSYGLASGRGVQGEPHYRTAFAIGQVARSSDSSCPHFTPFFLVEMTLLRDITRKELAQR